MKTKKILFACMLVAATAFSAAAEAPKTDVELAKYLRSQVKCDSGKNPVCSLSFRGLEIEFTDIKNPNGGAMAVLDIGPTQKYSNYGVRCVKIEFNDKDLIQQNAAAKGMGIVFRADGSIVPQSKNKEADALCQ